MPEASSAICSAVSSSAPSSPTALVRLPPSAIKKAGPGPRFQQIRSMSGRRGVGRLNRDASSGFGKRRRRGVGKPVIAILFAKGRLEQLAGSGVRQAFDEKDLIGKP